MAYPLTSSLPQSASIVSRWILDESSGNRADIVGSNTLIDTNTVGSSTGAVLGGTDFGTSADFIRTNTEYLSITNGSQSGLNITAGLTISAFVNLDDTSNDHAIAGKWQETSNQRQYLAHFSTNDGKWQFAVSSNGTAVKTLSSTTSAATGFKLLTFVYRPSTEMEIYINGVSDSNTTASVPASIFSGSGSFAVGVQSDTTSNFELMDGKMNDTIVWNTALSDAEVLSLYNAYVNFVAPSTINTYAYLL